MLQTCSNGIQSLVVCFSKFSLYCGCIEGAKHVNRHYCPGTLSPLRRLHLLRFITAQQKQRTFSLLLIVVSPLCISAEKKRLGFWHWIKSSPQTANKADILLSLHTLPRSAILTHFRTSVKPGSTLLLSRVHPIAVVPCKHVNPGSNCFVECMQCPPVSRVLRAASHNRSLSQWLLHCR